MVNRIQEQAGPAGDYCLQEKVYIETIHQLSIIFFSHSICDKIFLNY